jgi:hypothetical protein
MSAVQRLRLQPELTCLPQKRKENSGKSDAGGVLDWQGGPRCKRRNAFHVVATGTPNPSGFDLVVSATPGGMEAGDPSKIDAKQFVADLITMPLATSSHTQNGGGGSDCQ